MLGGKDAEVFSKIQIRSQLVDGGMARVDLGDRGAAAQPVRERRFAGLGLRHIHQLEQRSVSEEIEVARVWMPFEKRRSWTAHTDPAIVEAVESALVQAYRAARALAALQDAGVNHDQRTERNDSRQRP